MTPLILRLIIKALILIVKALALVSPLIGVVCLLVSWQNKPNLVFSSTPSPLINCGSLVWGTPVDGDRASLGKGKEAIALTCIFSCADFANLEPAAIMLSTIYLNQSSILFVVQVDTEGSACRLHNEGEFAILRHDCEPLRGISSVGLKEQAVVLSYSQALGRISNADNAIMGASDGDKVGWDIVGSEALHLLHLIKSNEKQNIFNSFISLLDLFLNYIFVYYRCYPQLSQQLILQSASSPFLLYSKFMINRLRPFYNLLISMSKEEAITKNINIVKRAKEEVSLLLKNKYALTLIDKKAAKEKGKGKEVTEGQDIKFQIKCPKGTRDYYPDQMAIRRQVIDTIVSIFRKHGGVELDTPVFELKEVLTGKYGQDSKLIYDLQDQGGQKCSLRYDLTVPFARFMANNTNIQKIKRFHIGKVYRRDQPTITKGRFREFYQCDFDIAGKYDAMIPDAQVLSIMQEILEALTVNDFLVKVNHRAILEAVVREAGCNLDLFKPICSSIDKLDKQPWSEVRVELLAKGVTEDQADVIGKLTTFRGEPLKLLEELINSNAFPKNAQFLSPTFEDMRKLFNYLTALGRIAKVSFDLSLARGLDYYTGLIYEIVLTDKTTQLGSISGGGRYDNLIGMFCQHQIPSVGGSIGIQRLFTILEGRLKDKVKQNACEILVATAGKVEVTQKLAVLSQLWAGDIKAETLYLEKINPDKQIGHAFEHSIPMILWLGEKEIETRQANLKILYKHQEVKVGLDGLVANLRPYIEQFKKDFQAGNVKLQDPKKAKK